MLKQRRKKANKKARVLKNGPKGKKSSLLLHLFVAKPVRKRVEKFL
mgnify:CR=1 FL=1